MLAVAAFAANLYQDVGGQPGALISNGTVHVGDTFFVEITAQDFSPNALGFAGVGLRIQWDPKALKEVELSVRAVRPEQPLGDAKFPRESRRNPRQRRWRDL